MRRRVQVSQGDNDGIGTQTSIGSSSGSAHPGRRSFAFYRNTSKASRGRAADVASERSAGDDAAAAADSGGVARSWSLNGMMHTLRSSRNGNGLHRSTSNVSAAPTSTPDAPADAPAAPAAAAAARPPALATASEDASGSSSPQSPQAHAAAPNGAAVPRARRRSLSDSGSPMPLPLELPDPVSNHQPYSSAGASGAGRHPSNTHTAVTLGEHDPLIDWASPLSGGMSAIPEVTETLTQTMEFPASAATGHLAAPGACVSRRLPDGPGPVEAGVGLSGVGVSTSTTDIMSGIDSPMVPTSTGIDGMSAYGDGMPSSSEGDSTGRRPTSRSSGISRERRL